MKNHKKKLDYLLYSITLKGFLEALCKVNNTLISKVFYIEEGIFAPSVEVHGLKGFKKHTQVVIKDEKDKVVYCLQVKVKEMDNDL